MFKTLSFMLFVVTYLSLPLSGATESLQQLSEASVHLSLEFLRNENNWKSTVISSPSIYEGLHLLQMMANGTTLEQLTSFVFDTSYVDTVENHVDELRRSISQLSNINLNYESILTMKNRRSLLIKGKGVKNRTVSQYNKLGDNTAKRLQDLNSNITRMTNNQIEDAFVNEKQEVPILLTCVTYLKGNWKYRFDKSLTKHNEPFYAESEKCKPNGHDVAVSMMTIEMPVPKKSFKEINADGIRLPFAGDDVSLYIFLPDPSVRVDQVMNLLHGPALMYFIEELKKAGENYEEDYYKIELPIFDAKTSVSLKSTLESFGVKNMFDPNKADFGTRLKRGSVVNPYVSDVKHDAVFQINEEGVDAAPEKEEMHFFHMAQDDVEEFRVNKPFIYVVANTETSEVYLLGRYMGPEC